MNRANKQPSLEGERSRSLDSKIVFFNRRLLKWFARKGRKYPWREISNPFNILIAELMLQRTKADQVLPVYLDFMKKFPDPDSMMHAVADDLKSIHSLGLVRRSKVIVEMSKYLREGHGSLIPSSRDELLKIPGVGDYTADAMVVFAFNHRRTVVDSNVVRLVSRFFGIGNKKGEMRRNIAFVNFCQLLNDNVDDQNIKEFNWALIDFPAVICKTIPLCKICPLSSKCSYFKGASENSE